MQFFQSFIKSDRKHENYILIFLFILALLIRLIGINYGYWHGDERINDAAKVLTGELVPGQHFYPPLFNYINAFFFGLLYAIGRLIPLWYNTEEFRAQYFSDPTMFYLTARFFTAVMSALVAPLLYILAKSLKFTQWQSATIGLFGVLLPVMVLLSHLSKSDVPLATTAIWVFYLLIKKYQNMDIHRYDYYLGFAIALAMSFKHSYIFMLVPLMFGHIFLLYRTVGVPNGVMALVRSACVMLPAWCIFNIGILLDFNNFLDFQKIQAQMSVREGETVFQALAAWLTLSAHHSYGINGIGTLSFILFPFYLNTKMCGFYNDRLLLNVCWVSVALGMLVVSIMSGTRQHSGLWVPYFTCMQLFVALLLVDLMRVSNISMKYLARGSLTLCFLLSSYGTLKIWQQSLAQPVSKKVADVIQQHYRDKKIATSFLIDLPQSKAAQTQEFSRHDRLAEKYRVTMPERSLERYIESDAENAVYYVNMPAVMFGLEHTDDESLGDAIKPYTWPLQKEEWVLSHWLNQGFDIFVVSDIQYFLHDVPSQIFKDFYRDMQESCKKSFDFLPEKRFFLEANVSIYDCS